MNEDFLAVRSPLTVRLLRRMLLCSAAFIVLLAAGRLWWEYRAAVQAVQEVFAVIGETATKGMSASLWDFDRKQLHLQVESVRHFRYITYAAVNDASGVVDASGQSRTDDVLNREFPLSVPWRGHTENVGALHVQADLGAVKRQALSAALSGLAFNAVLVFLVMGLLFALTRSMISRHLAAVATHLGGLSLKDGRKRLHLDKSADGDELDVLAQAINVMQDRLASSYSQVLATQEALRESSERYRSVIENMQDVYYRTDAQGRIVMMSPSALQLLGCASMDELLGRPIASLYLAEAEHQDFLTKITRQGVVRDHEITLKRKNGTPLAAAATSTLYRDETGNVLGVEGIFRDVTVRKSLELRLAEQLAFQQTLIDTIPHAIFYKGSDTRFLGFNKAYEECFGVRRESLIGRRVLDLEYLSPEDRRNYQAEDEAVIARVGQVRKEMPIPFADGQVHQTLYSVTGFRLMDGSPGGLIGIIVDISERKLAEEQLRQSEEKFSRIFEMAPESISFVRLKDSVRIAANAAFETITGYSREQAIGRSIQELNVWEEPPQREEFLKQLQTNRNVRDFEFMLRRKDGTLRRVVSSARLLSIAGEDCYVSIIHDITDEHRMQELLIQSEKMMSVGSLAAGIAHEINNPLGIVHQAVQNLMQRINPEQKKNLETAARLGLDMPLLQQYVRERKLDVFLHDIQDAALRASDIIRNMLNFSRRSESRRQACDLTHIIRQSMFLASSDYDLKKAYDFKRIEIVLNLAENLPACMCTETEIEQVLLNLLRNAAQAMSMAQPPTPNPRIEIRLRAGEGCVRIEVADNGPGMDPKIQHKAFDPFFTTKPPGVGTGLGLSVSYFIITKSHAGRMWFDSAPGKGMTFFIELPTEPVGAAPV
ncbi:PAS domain S-box protein [Humidesulfovibrio idahonensis]